MNWRETISSRLAMRRSRVPFRLLAIGLGMVAVAAFVPSVANARANARPSIPDDVTAELSWPMVKVAWDESSSSADRQVDGYNIYVNGEYKDTEKGGLFHHYNVEGLSGTVVFQVTSFDDGDPRGFSPMSEVATVDLGDRPNETEGQAEVPMVVLDPPVDEVGTPIVGLDPPVDDGDSPVVILDPPAEEADSPDVVDLSADDHDSTVSNDWDDAPHPVPNQSTTASPPPVSAAPVAQGGSSARLAVAGDVGTGGPEAYKTAEVIDSFEADSEYDAFVILGDNVYEFGDADQVGEKVLQPFGPVLDNGTKLHAVLGNHDVQNDNGPAQAKALDMPGMWYSVKVGDATIIALDSNHPHDSEQLAWLESTLAAVDTKWTIAIMHHPAYSAGHHGDSSGVKKTFVPLFNKFNVDLVLAGHDHDYQRNKVIDGVTYVVTGAAAKLRPTGSNSNTVISRSVHHYIDLTIDSDQITGRAIGHDGKTFDTFTVK